jgi:hypothetical protein
MKDYLILSDLKPLFRYRYYFSLISGKLNKEAETRFIPEIHQVQMKI